MLGKVISPYTLRVKVAMVFGWLSFLIHKKEEMVLFTLCASICSVFLLQEASLVCVYYVERKRKWKASSLCLSFCVFENNIWLREKNKS